MRFTLLALSVLLSSLSAQAARGPVRDIFGANLCADVPFAQYRLVRGNAACPRTATIANRPIYFIMPEFGIQASMTNDFISNVGKGKKLGGEQAEVFRRAGEIDCAELSLDCRGQVSISYWNQMAWDDSCNRFEMDASKRYTRVGSCAIRW